MKKELFKNKSLLFYVGLYAVYLVLALTSGALHQYAVYNIPAELYHDSFLKAVISILQSLANGLKDWFWILLIYWGVQLFRTGRSESYPHMMAASLMVIVATQVVAFGSAFLLKNSEIMIYLKLFAIFTVVVFAVCALLLGIVFLKNSKASRTLKEESGKEKLA